MPIDKTRIKYFTVKWTALVSLIDGLDLDDLPDTDTITGVVTFKALSGGPLKFRSNITGSEPFTVFPLTRRVNIASGEFSEQSRKYIKLEAASADHVPAAWNWQVIFDLSYNGTPLQLSATSFMGAPNEVIDLTDYLPVKDLVSGIEYARGPQGFSVFDISVSGDRDEILTFVSDAPGNPIIRQVTIPQLNQATDAAGVAVAASNIAETAKTLTLAARDQAVSSRDTAVSSASAALTSRNQASTSEANALASKNAAGTSETNAAGSAASALASKNSATTSETNANTSKNMANTYATNAGNSATAAAGSATASQNSRLAAETARTGAEQARDAATTMVVPDASVTRPKLKTQDHTNLLFGGGFENGIETSDWPVNGYGANLTVDTSVLWEGTRSLRVAGPGNLQSVEIPTCPGEVFSFTAMTQVPTAVVGPGGMRVQWKNGASVWSDIANFSSNSEASALAAGVWTRGQIIALMPADARAVRIRIAHANSNYGSGIYYDDMDWRRIIDTLLPQSVTSAAIANSGVGSTQLANGAVIAGKLANGAVDSYTRVDQIVSDLISLQSVKYHDLLAFLNGITLTTETTTDSGATWGSVANITALFNSREGEFNAIGSAAAGQGVRFTFVGSTTPISNSNARALQIGFGYTATAPNRTILVESSPDGTTWTNRLNATGVSNNASTLIANITDWGTHTRVRITIINTNASGMNLSAVKLLVARPGGEGRSREGEYPFNWDFARNMIFLAGIRLPNLSGMAAGRLLVLDASGNVSGTLLATASIADGAVTSAKIADGTIVTADLADNAITSAKIVDGTIATVDIADNAITSAKIADGTITSADIADGTITDADISPTAAIALGKLANGITVGMRDGAFATTFVNILTEAQYQARVTAGTIDPNTLYFRTA